MALATYELMGVPDLEAPEEPFLSLAPGQVAGLVGPAGFGLTRVGLQLLSEHAGRGLIACLDARGWLSPVAVWESGIDPDQFIVVRCDDPARWGRVASVLLDGVAALYAEVPRGIKDPHLRKLAALAKARKTPLVLRPVRRDLPPGVAHLRLDAGEVIWEGIEQGHGRLAKRRLAFTASGKAMRGMSRQIEVEDDGTDVMRLVSGLAFAPARRAVG